MKKEKRVWLISEAFYPEESGGAHYMTKLAEGLSKVFAVHVICGYPQTINNSLQKRMNMDGVTIERCYGTAFDKTNIFLRLVNVLTISISMFVKALFNIGRRDTVIVLTAPPALPFVVSAARFLRRFKLILRIDDVYPEAMIAAGLIGKENRITRIMHWLTSLLYGHVDRIIVLGRDMKQLAENKIKNNFDKITIINNWADLDIVAPKPRSESVLLAELGLMDKFVVVCAGNMGLAQDIENMFMAAELLKEKDNIHFLFIGSGVKRKWMENEVCNKKLRNITILDQRPRLDQRNFLNACDIAMISLKNGMKGAGVPSRMYNIMAVGKPIIAISEFDSELSLVVEEEDIGWVVSPGNSDQLAKAIIDAHSKRNELIEVGRRAHIVANSKYSPKVQMSKYHQMLNEFS